MATLGKVSVYDSSATWLTGERGRFRRAGLASVAMHGLAFGLLLAFAWTVRRVKEPELPFMVVSDRGSPPGPAVDAGAGPVMALPESRLFVAPPSVRSWVPPRAPEVEPAVTSRPARSRPREVATSSPRLTHEQYLAQTRSPRSASSASVPSDAGSVTAGRIDLSAIRDADAGRGDPIPGGVGREAEAGMPEYFADLIRRLRDAHRKPAGLSDLLSTLVEFTVTANGEISGVRIVRSSGDAAFDRSVRDALAEVKMPARPDGLTDSRMLTFRMTDA